MILGVITLLIQLLPQILAGAGIISPAIKSLISDLGAEIPAVIAAFTLGKSVPDSTMALLAAFRDEIAKLKADTTLSPHALAMADTLTLALGQALGNYQVAELVDDPSTLTPLPTDVANLEPMPATATPHLGETARLGPALQADAVPLVDPHTGETIHPAETIQSPDHGATRDPSAEPPEPVLSLVSALEPFPNHRETRDPDAEPK